jgi:integrase
MRTADLVRMITLVECREPPVWRRDNAKEVSSRLGHSSAGLTLSTYAHLLPGADQDAAQRIDDLLSGSKTVAKRA